MTQEGLPKQVIVVGWVFWPEDSEIGIVLIVEDGQADCVDGRPSHDNVNDPVSSRPPEDRDHRPSW
jgi:hypothetical protein